MKIFVHPLYRVGMDYDELYQLRRVSNELRDYGVFFVENRKDADYEIVFPRQMTRDDVRMPSIAFASHARSIVHWRTFFKHPDVKLWVVKSMADTFDKQNCGRLHYHTISLGDYDSNVEPITKEEYSKIRIATNLTHYQRHEFFLNNNLDMNKDVGTFFNGTLKYSNKYIDAHRHNFYNIISKSRHFVDVPFLHQFGQTNYNRLILRTKVIVSPWGRGEHCYRDAEAMFADCVLIKPYSDYVINNPLLYKDGITYISCKSDGSDLLEKINYAMDEWDNLAEMRERNRRMLIDSWDKDYVLDIYKNIFESIM